jgi:hypothetical protein
MKRRRWLRKATWDAETDGFSPMPMRVVFNEEYLPLPQTRDQAQVAALLRATAARNARRLGISRRTFLESSAGMAATLLAFNAVFGRVFKVDPVEALESAAANARKPAGRFVFDIQTHHVASPRQFPPLLRLRALGRQWNPALAQDRYQRARGVGATRHPRPHRAQ